MAVVMGIAVMAMMAVMTVMAMVVAVMTVIAAKAHARTPVADATCPKGRSPELGITPLAIEIPGNSRQSVGGKGNNLTVRHDGTPKRSPGVRTQRHLWMGFRWRNAANLNKLWGQYCQQG